MSANIHILITVHTIPRAMEDAVSGAVDEVLRRRQIHDLLRGPVPLPDGEGLAWTSNPACPVIISAAHHWVPLLARSIKRAVTRASAGQGRAQVEAIYDEERRWAAPTLRTMKKLHAACAAGRPRPPRARPVTPAARELAERWHDLQRVFGPLRRLHRLETAGLAVRFGSGTVRTKSSTYRALVTCGLSLAGLGGELYVLPVEQSDLPFAEVFLTRAAKAMLRDAELDAEGLQSSRMTVGLGRIGGTEILALLDPDTGRLPRKLSRGVALVPLTSVTRTLARKKTPDGTPFLNAEDLAPFYPHFGRVRDPKQPDASRLATGS